MILSKKTRIFKILKRVVEVLWWCILALLFVTLVNIVGSKLMGKVPSVFGYSVMNIVSGSMEDEIPKDSYILIKRQDADTVRKNDIICFYSSDPKIYGMPNTHRVVEDPIITEDGIEFVTRGDANGINDKVTAKGDRLIGVYVKTLDGLTAFTKLLHGKTMIIVIVCLQIAAFSMFGYGLYNAKKNENKNKNKEKTAEETVKKQESKEET